MKKTILREATRIRKGQQWQSHLTVLFIFGLMVISSFQANAQGSHIHGTVQDEKGQPLSFVNVTLLKEEDSTLVSTTLSDSLGKFALSINLSGNFILRLTAIGYQPAQTKVAEVSGNTTIPSITLQSEIGKLTNVTVTTMRPTITQLADRMVVSVEGTAMAAGNNAFTVLSKAPGVFVDHEGNIQLNGRSGVTVMIDGKLTYLSARDLRTLLESMPAENLKNIEIITNPSAKYDAAGTSGILNINLKKNTQQGVNGSIYANYMTNLKQHAPSFGGNVNYKTGNWNSFFNIDKADRVGGREATFTRVFHDVVNTYFDQTATSEYKVKARPSLRLGTDYSLNKMHSVGFMLGYTSNKIQEGFFTDTYIGDNPKNPSRYIEASNYTRNRYSNTTGNIHYYGTLDTAGTTLSSDLFYVRISNRGSGDYLNYFTNLLNGQRTQDILYTNTPNGYSIYSGKIDFSKALKHGAKLETGLKASKVISDNDFRFYFNNTGVVLDPARTNYFKYEEEIYAAYLNYSGNLSKKLSLQTGLRGEQTVSDGRSITTGQTTKRKYTNLFPSVFLQQKVSENYGISYNYSRRLTRPNYGSLNPFRSYRDPYTYVEGNPYLRPQYTHSFSLSQSFKKIYILQISYQLTKDVITEVPIPDAATATTIYTTGNVNKGRNLAVLGIVPVKLSKWWDTQNTLQLSYNKYAAQSGGNDITNDQVTFLWQTIQTILLPKGIRMEATFLYRGPVASGYYHMAAISRLDLAIRKSFLKKKLDLAINGSDLYKGQRFLWSANYNGNVNEFDQYLRFRTFNLNLRYNFSKGQKVNTRKSNTLEEINRAG